MSRSFGRLDPKPLLLERKRNHQVKSSISSKCKVSTKLKLLGFEAWTKQQAHQYCWSCLNHIMAWWSRLHPTQILLRVIVGHNCSSSKLLVKVIEEFSTLVRKPPCVEKCHNGRISLLEPSRPRNHAFLRGGGALLCARNEISGGLWSNVELMTQPRIMVHLQQEIARGLALRLWCLESLDSLAEAEFLPVTIQTQESTFYLIPLVVAYKRDSHSLHRNRISFSTVTGLRPDHSVDRCLRPWLCSISYRPCSKAHCRSRLSVGSTLKIWLDTHRCENWP